MLQVITQHGSDTRDLVCHTVGAGGAQIFLTLLLRQFFFSGPTSFAVTVTLLSSAPCSPLSLHCWTHILELRAQKPLWFLTDGLFVFPLWSMLGSVMSTCSICFDRKMFSEFIRMASILTFGTQTFDDLHVGEEICRQNFH